VLTRELLREDEALTQVAFTRLLEWLDQGVDSHGERYLETRRRLVVYFDRRNRPSADELADETLNRVGRTLEADGAIAIKPPARYCYIVARFVLLEDIRRGRRQVHFEESGDVDRASARGAAPVEADDHEVVHEQRLECLDRCLEELRPAQRQLVIEYYRDARRQRIERRRDLAARLGITMNALGIRAYRLRDTLMTCVEGCRPA
jgi:DNA-directed RNA polymerase specialized sigma24 family protein